MEKVQIVRYALMQLAALVYGVMACGVAVRLGRDLAESGMPMPGSYYLATFVRDYGSWFFLLVFIWTGFASYQSSGFSRREVSETTLTVSGIGIALLFALAGTIIALSAAAQPRA